MEINEKDLEQQIDRLNNLRKETILLFSDEIDYDEDRDFIVIDSLIKHLVKGDLNDYYDSSLLEGFDDKTRNKILNTVNKYSYLIFHKNNVSNWYDSVDMDFVDYETIAVKLLEYYDFLIEININGGENALKELSKYSEYDAFTETSVVDYLMRTFASKEVLAKIIIDMSVENGPFNIINTDQRACLLKKPLGILYYNEDNDVTYINPIGLMNKVKQREGDFEDIISEISDNYYLSAYNNMGNS